jgi:acyl-CoA thioesterase I
MAAASTWALGMGCAALMSLPNAAEASAAKPAGTAPTARTTIPGKAVKILVFGDSLSAEYGLARGSGWVALLSQRLNPSDKPAAQAPVSTQAASPAAHLPSRMAATIVNASVSGETTSGGLRRLPAQLAQHQPTHVVLELGANDALRGLPVKATEANLSRMVEMCKQSGAKVVLVGMMMPPNFGKRYADEFAAAFPAVGKAQGVPVVPFFLKGVADRPDAREWFQADGIHPLARAHPVMLDNVWQALRPLL